MVIIPPDAASPPEVSIKSSTFSFLRVRLDCVGNSQWVVIKSAQYANLDRRKEFWPFFCESGQSSIACIWLITQCGGSKNLKMRGRRGIVLKTVLFVSDVGVTYF